METGTGAIKNEQIKVPFRTEMAKSHYMDIRGQAETDLYKFFRVQAALWVAKVVLKPALDLVPPDRHPIVRTRVRSLDQSCTLSLSYADLHNAVYAS